MSYIIRGRLCAYLCKSCFENLSNVIVRFYRIPDDVYLTDQITANTDDTLRLLSEEEVKAKSNRLLAEVGTDENGKFELTLDAEEHKYKGEAVEVNVVLDRVPNQKDEKKQRHVQLGVTFFQPPWREGNQDDLYADFDFCFPERFWCAIRSLFDAWVICGRVRLCDGQGQPVAGVKVTAFDSDWITDDNLGSATTDANGHFRIDYTSRDFKQTFLSPIINVETPFSYKKGPDVYFKVETTGTPSAVLLNETRPDGFKPGRKNIGNCFCIDLCLEQIPVDLDCEITSPAGCIHGDPNIQPGSVLEPILGTAAGIGFDRYELELFWNGTLDVSAAIIYADTSGNPDTGLTNGNHTVSGGTLGFVDIEKAVQETGSSILSSTNFLVRLTVFGIDNSTEVCQKTFTLAAAKAFIKYIGGGWAHNVIDPNEPLRRSDSPSAELVSVGGNISVRGAADVYGCSAEKIAGYTLWYKSDPSFSIPQPANGTAYDPAANSWNPITSVTFSNDDQRLNNKLDGTPNPSWLTNNSVWGTRTQCVYIPPSVFCFSVPDLKEFKWGSPASGKYALLLKVVDTGGNTFYDLQRVWIDNEPIHGKIKALRYRGETADLPPCTDVLIGDGSGNINQLLIRGFATDPVIVPSDPLTLPNDNFQKYSISLSKQGVGGEVSLVHHSPNPVPDRATWTSGVGEPPLGILSTLDLGWLDAATPAPTDAAGNPVPASHRLARGSSCTYDLILRTDDKSIVNEGTDHHVTKFTFPVKIVNNLP